MMKSRIYFPTVGAIFSLIAVLHVLRLTRGWDAQIGGWEVPMWLSWVAIALAGYLAYHAFRLKKESGR